MFKLIAKGLKVLASMKDARGRLGKSAFRSKTLWVNIIAILAIVFKDYLGITLTVEETTAILAVINMFLRLITSEPVGFLK